MKSTARAFVIRPFNEKKDSAGREIDFERVHTELIDPALKAARLAGSTTGEIIEAGNIREDMFSLILEADLVICDVTIHNANVFYELGIRHSLRKKHSILIRETSSADSIPFDLLTDRYMPYSLDELEDGKKKLTDMIEASLHSDRETDSPIFKMLPTLREADPSTVTDKVVPKDFREEVERAQAGMSKGWLRLLAQDVLGQRYQWIALQLIADAQLNLKDYEGARESLEAIRQTQRDNADANLSLANVYERLFRSAGRPELLTKSDHAIERVLASDKITQKQRLESLALKGRNQKTRWRREFERLTTVEERRDTAMNLALRTSYEAYRDAFYQDLNHFWSGLAALQMGTVFLELSTNEQAGWKDTFDDDEEAEAYRRHAADEVAALQLLVPASVEAGLLQMDATDPQRVWAQISKADTLFLTESRAQRVLKRYEDVVPKDTPFVWDAAKGQLQLFADLGIKKDLACSVIAAIDVNVEAPKKDIEKPDHVVVFVGHRVDSPGRDEPRFPAEKVDYARSLIHQELSRLNKDYVVQGLASALPGADILFHEICDDLGIPSTLCLPMPAADYVRLTYEDMDDWRSRFLNLQRSCAALELSDRAGLPRWLHGTEGTKINPWERGNRWVLQMGLTSEAEEVTLIALWDRRREGDAPGGTAHMVQLARDAGRVHINIIDAQKLLA